MSNFKCPVCHMANIDCGQDGYKTDKEIKLEKEIDKLQEQNNKLMDFLYDCNNGTTDKLFSKKSGVLIKEIKSEG